MVAERGRPRLAEHIADMLVPLITEEIVEVLKTVFQEQISERICKQIVDQVTEVPKTSNRDRTLQCTAEQIFDVPGPEMATQLVEVPENISQDRIQQRTVEQIVDFPVPQVVQELAEVCKIFSQDRIQQRTVEQTIPAISLDEKIIEVPMEVSHVFPQDRVHQCFVEQIIEAPAISLDEQIIETPVIQTHERTQHLVNTHVQQVVNTVEVEEPKLIKETGQRKKPIVQEKINQVTKHIDVPQVQFLDKAGDMLVGMQRHVPMTQTVRKTVEVPPLQFTGKVSDIPVEAPRQILWRCRRSNTLTRLWMHLLWRGLRTSPSGRRLSPGRENIPWRPSLLTRRQTQNTVSSKGGSAGSKWTRLVKDMRRGKIPICSRWRLTWRPVAHTSRPRQRRSESWIGPKTCARSAEWSSSLVRRERKLDVKADVAVRRLERLEREHSQLEDEEREASLQDALADRTKVVKLVVDKWFVDKGFGFGKAPTGEVVFIHATVVRGAEVLTIGTDAWVQVMHDDARAQGGIEHAKPGDAPRGKRRKTRRGQQRWQSKSDVQQL